MSFYTRAFWKTLWQDKKALIIAIVAVLVIVIGFYTYFQMKRSWNWNVGGYKSRAYDMVCEMAKDGVVAKGPKWEAKCK